MEPEENSGKDFQADIDEMYGMNKEIEDDNEEEKCSGSES